MQYRRPVRIWLWCGVVMVFVQIVLGGVTRLTGSGLSITKWEIVTGTIPPLNQEDWQTEFNKYKQTPQYQKINAGMSLSEFKFIYFWEYIHRLWARSIGVVFIIPFLVFLIKKWLDKKLLQELGITVLLGLVVATFGWIMVASGLVDRPWVSAYKLTIHLNLALILFSWLTWIAIGAGNVINYQNNKIKSVLNVLTILVIIQLVLGGIMSGMKAGLYYPTWPDMYGEFFPKVLLDKSVWSVSTIVNYETGPMPGVIQFSHRVVAYAIFFVSMILFWRSRIAPQHFKQSVNAFFLMVILQICLGILTVINCIGSIPLLLAVLHQITAIFLLIALINIRRKMVH